MKRILFDITPIAEGYLNSACRTGIYFATINILEELSKKNEIYLYFYCNHKFSYALIHKYNIVNAGKCALWVSRCIFFLEIKRDKYKQENRKVRHFFLAGLSVTVGYLAEHITGISKKELKKFDIFISIKHQAPKKILTMNKIKKIIVLHDMIEYIYPMYFKVKFRKLRKSITRKIVETATNDELFIANSQQTKNDFLKYRPDILEKNVKLAYHACSSYFYFHSDKNKYKDIREKYHIPENKKYIFSLCAIEPRKNLIRIVRTFLCFIKRNKIDDLVMILGGKAWGSFEREFENSVDSMNDFNTYIIRTGYIEDMDLPILYSGAEWFVYTSQYEGFGVPPLEAMSCGCPVIVSNNSSLPEVVGDAGLLIDWDSDEQHIHAYEEYYFNDEKKNQYSQKGLIRSKQFSWVKMVNELLEYMEYSL